MDNRTANSRRSKQTATDTVMSKHTHHESLISLALLLLLLMLVKINETMQRC